MDCPEFGTNFNGTIGAQGLNTAALQAALPSGFNSTVNGGCASCWGIIPDQTYPFFIWQPGVIAGTVYTTYSGMPVTSGIDVYDIINGVAGATPVVTSTSGGYLFYLGAGGIPSGSNAVTYISGATNGVAFQEGASGSIAGLNIYGTYLAENAASSSVKLSTVAADLVAATGHNTLPTTSNLAC